MGRGGGRWVNKRREWGETVRCAHAILVPTGVTSDGNWWRF